LEKNMNRLLIAAGAALLMTAGVAVAQPSTSQTTTSTTVAPAVVAPAPGTLSTTSSRKTIDSDGKQTDTTRTTYRNTDGVADDSVTRTTTSALPVETTTRSSTTTTIVH
jgi:hypothetical protein